MYKIIQTRNDSASSARALNSLMAAGIMLWFVAHQNLFTPLSVKYGPADVTKATQYQPSTPPPLPDPESIDVDAQEVEPTWNVWSHQ